MSTYLIMPVTKKQRTDDTTVAKQEGDHASHAEEDSTEPLEDLPISCDETTAAEAKEPSKAEETPATATTQAQAKEILVATQEVLEKASLGKEEMYWARKARDAWFCMNCKALGAYD